MMKRPLRRFGKIWLKIIPKLIPFCRQFNRRNTGNSGLLIRLIYRILIAIGLGRNLKLTVSAHPMNRHEEYCMNKKIILGIAAASLSVCSWTAFAASDSQYPASDFQPKVVFIDEDAAATSSSSSNSNRCPDQQAKVKQTEYDPNYPAASFEPKVVYP